MKQKIQPWFELTISHKYFVNSIFKGGQLVPFMDSKNKMKQYGLLLRQYRNQYTLLASWDLNNENLTWNERLAQVSNLYFYLTSKDVNFLNYTNLPMETGTDQQFYFTNQQGKQTIQKGATVTDADQLKSYPSIFTLPIPKTEKVNVLIKDSTGTVVWKKTLNGLVQPGAGASVSASSWPRSRSPESFSS